MLGMQSGIRQDLQGPNVSPTSINHQTKENGAHG